MNNQNRFGFLSAMPPVTKNLIIINALCWIACIVFQETKIIPIDPIQWLALHYPASKDFKLIQIVSYMFLHDTRFIAHLFFNMFAVYMFGRILESVWGGKRFLIYYLASGIGAALTNLAVIYIRIRLLERGMDAESIAEVYQHGGAALREGMNYRIPVMAALNSLINTPTVGASGAVFGILLAYGMLFPESSLYVMFLPIPIKAKYFVIGYGVIELFFGFADFRGDNVAHFAHLGGMLFGYLLIMYWEKSKKHESPFY